MDSLGAVFRVIPTTSRVAEGSGTTSSNTFPSNTTGKLYSYIFSSFYNFHMPKIKGNEDYNRKFQYLKNLS